jgi:hypothetical protein
MTAYSKLIAALVSLAIGFGVKHGLDLSGQEALITDAVTAIVTALAVWYFPNRTGDKPV